MIVIFRTKNIVVKIRGEQIVDKQFKIKDAISFSIMLSISLNSILLRTLWIIQHDFNIFISKGKVEGLQNRCTDESK